MLNLRPHHLNIIAKIIMHRKDTATLFVMLQHIAPKHTCLERTTETRELPQGSGADG